MKRFFFPILFLFVTCNSEPENVDILITGGIIHDGTGNKGYLGNVAIKNDTIFYVGKNQNFIAKDLNQYIDLAKKISTDIDYLKVLRLSLREKLKKSSLCDGVSFAKDIEDTYKFIYEDYFSKQKI